MSARLRWGIALAALAAFSFAPTLWGKDAKGPLTQATFEITGMS